ncbi:MAG: hybrid sensor histidine kinase/response regulator [Deltaproteobacteria bacterium]|nr:hybrid sensor histidine kinase/response regulator [Deltaproteobacteria bacterium]
MSAPPTILIVDDEAPNRRLLESILKREGFTTCSAENGRACIERVQHGDVDLVLLDLMMPVLGGVEACRAIREDLHQPFLPVVLVTALNDRNARVRGKEAGADDFIAKPVYAEELLARVRVLLRAQQFRREADERRAALEVARRRLTGLLVHDLKNPLGVVRLNLQHIERELEDDPRELRAAARDALTACEQIQHMLLDMLDVGMAEDGRLPFTPTPGDLGAVVKSTAHGHRPVVEARGARLQLDVPDGLPRVSYDASLVVRVLQNLLGNASRYVGPLGVVEVSARAEGDSVVVSVGNDGPRIAPEVQARLFDKFGQVNDGQKHGNRGLGLYFCRLVAERHGGSMAVRDREGGGALFELALPILRNDEVTASSSPDPQEPPTSSR